MKALFRDLSHWFFQSCDARVAAGMRIGFCLTYLLMLWDIRPVLQLLFGHAGLYGTLEPYPFSLDRFQYLLYRYDSPLGLELWFWGSVLAAVGGMLGVWPRLTLPLTYLSMLLFRERGPFITFGADLVLNCIGLFVLFLDTGRAWTIRHSGAPARTVEGWPLRAIQVQMALIYLVTGLAKLQTVPWQDGSAVYYALHVGSVTKTLPPDFILGNRLLLVLMTYGTLVIELSVPFILLAYKPLRYHAIAACVALHSGIDLLMSIRFFSLVMYVGLWSFVSPTTVDQLQRLVQRAMRRSARTALTAEASGAPSHFRTPSTSTDP